MKNNHQEGLNIGTKVQMPKEMQTLKPTLAPFTQNIQEEHVYTIGQASILKKKVPCNQEKERRAYPKVWNPREAPKNQETYEPYNKYREKLGHEERKGREELWRIAHQVMEKTLGVYTLGNFDQ